MERGSVMKTQLSLPQAKTLAEKIKGELAPGCERIEVAGSIRRQKPVIGDIELVAIPLFARSLFPDVNGQSLLDIQLGNLVEQGRLIPGDKNGQNYKNFYIPAVDDLKLDLFITSPEYWPVIFAIRTGSAEFSRRLVTPRNKGGFLPSHLRVKGGSVWDGDKQVELITEADFLELCGGWVEPEKRN
jgi:DNA polymerase/3'-5' exonuclease PolX